MTEESPAQPDPPALTEDEVAKLQESAKRISSVVGASPVDFPAPAPASALPDWATMPAGLEPPAGVSVGFLRFKPEWTRTPQKGERTCVVWSLTDLDERLAFSRVRDNLATAVNEMAKQMIRAVDGVKVNWNAKPGEPGNLEEFWSDIGPKCRTMVTRYYNRTHMMQPEEVADFLETCVVVATAD